MILTVASPFSTSACPISVSPSSRYISTVPLFTFSSNRQSTSTLIETLPAVLFTVSGVNETSSLSTSSGPTVSFAKYVVVPPYVTMIV